MTTVQINQINLYFINCVYQMFIDNVSLQWT